MKAEAADRLPQVPDTATETRDGEREATPLPPTEDDWGYKPRYSTYLNTLQVELLDEEIDEGEDS